MRSKRYLEDGMFMASGTSGEVVHCPNCNEDVPKTLYCLNCGFPLYKEEQGVEEKPETEVAEIKPEVKEKPSSSEEDTVIIVDEEPEEKIKDETKLEQIEAEAQITEPEAPPPEIPVTEEPNKEVVQLTSPQITIESEVKRDEPTVEATPVTIEVPAPIVEEIRSEPGSVSTVEVPSQEKAATPSDEMPSSPIESPKLAEETLVEKEEPSPINETLKPAIIEEPIAEPVTEESLSTRIEPKLVVGKMEEQYEDEVMRKEYVPDALTRDLMESLLKNISLKIKLAKFYREGQMKEETFTKLFEKYVEEGSLWSSRREEMMKILNAEIEEMEEINIKSMELLELIEIRRSIGDASELEYAAKAPAYKWDIENFENQITDKKNKLAYMENIGMLLTKEEAKELRELASTQYNTLDALQISNEEILVKLKNSLYEAIKNLG